MKPNLLLTPLLAGTSSVAAFSVASLGSSYSYGAGLSKSYGQRLADLLSTEFGQKVDYFNFAVDGSQLSDVTNTQASKLKGTSSTVVVITSGGNDLDYVGCLSGSSACGDTISQETFTNRYSDALSAIEQYSGNPNTVSIYAVTYPRAIGPHTKCSSSNEECELPPSKVTAANDIYENLVDWTVSALDTWQNTGSNDVHRVKLIPMREYSVDHDVGSAIPWVNGRIDNGAHHNGSAWHPTEDGAQFIAEAIYNDLNKKGPPPH